MEGGGEGEEEKTKKRLYVTESLGWLTESSIMPKKHRNIEGVGASSIFELKAQLYKTQEEAKKSKELAPDIEYHRAKKKIVAFDVLSQKNSGVDARAHKDKLELKAVKDGSNSYAALEKKAELYDKLVRGELPDEEEKEKYCVDFFQKGLVEDKLEQPSQGGDTSAISVENENDDPKASMLFSSKQIGPGRTAGELNNDEHKRFVREVHTEATEAREKASVLKLQRQEQATARREKLRQAYLRKQLEKLTAAAKMKDS